MLTRPGHVSLGVLCELAQKLSLSSGVLERQPPHCLSLTFRCLSSTFHYLSLTFHCLSRARHCLCAQMIVGNLFENISSFLCQVPPCTAISLPCTALSLPVHCPSTAVHCPFTALPLSFHRLSPRLCCSRAGRRTAAGKCHGLCIPTTVQDPRPAQESLRLCIRSFDSWKTHSRSRVFSNRHERLDGDRQPLPQRDTGPECVLVTGREN